MRTITAAQQAALDARARGLKLRVRIKDASGTWHDLTDIRASGASAGTGTSFLQSVEWGEGVDDAHITASIALKLTSYDLSLSPLMDGSPVNKGWNPLGAISALIELRREVKVEVQFGAADVADPGDWMEVFHGRIDTWTASGEDSISLECRDTAGAIQDAFIERERAYGLGTAKGVLIWEDQRAYALNDRLVPAGALNGRVYKCTIAGTSGTVEPNWPTTIGVAVTDGTAEWQCEANTSSAGEAVETVIQKILDDQGLSPAVTLYTPSSPAWNIGAFKQQREGTLEALRRLAQQQGSDVRQKWRAGTSQFELTYYAPDRAKTTPDRTFSVGEYRSISRLGVDIANIRNVVRVIYSDPADLASDGKTPKRKVVEVSDSASITKYGRRFMEIAEDGASQIDTNTEATNLANYALQDLATPVAEVEVDAAFFPWVELGDLYRFPSDGFSHDTNLDLAVTGYRHSWSASEDGLSSSTVLQCRGKPSGGTNRWLEVESKPGVGKVHQLQQLGGATVTATPVVGGAKLTITQDRNKDAVWDGAEFHVSTSSGFTPGASTLKGDGKSKTISLDELEPAKTHYAKVIPRGQNAGQLIVGKPSAEVSFVAGQLKALHHNSELGGTPAPLNGGFESFWGTGEDLPDHWSMVTGAYGTGRDAYRSTTAHSGVYAMELRATAAATKIRSAYFPVEQGLTYELSCWLQRINDSANTWSIKVEWYTSAKAAVSTSTLASRSNTSLASAGWVRFAAQVAAPSTAAFARITVEKDVASSTYGLLIDDVRMEPAPAVATHIESVAGATQTTTSSTFATILSGTVVTTKPSQKILCVVSFAGWSTVGSTAVGLQLLLNGAAASSDYPFLFNTASQHDAVSFVAVITGPTNPGSYTLALQWRRRSGTGTLTTDNNDFLSIVALPL